MNFVLYLSFIIICLENFGILNKKMWRQSNQSLLKILKKFELIRPYSVRKPPSCQEVQIPVPWGVIAGKWWGPQDKRPILGWHGWQDNCGTFDSLIPHLPNHLGYLVLDFPGHGLSSQLPPGTFYHGVDNVIVIKRVIDYFNWSKVSLMGHSLGAIMNYCYTIVYPDTVDFLIAMDGIKPLVFEDKAIERMVKTIQSFIKYDTLNNKKTEPPSYPYEVLEKLLHEGTRKSIALESCKYLLKRNIAPSTKDNNLYYFTRDSRLKVSPLLGWTQKEIMDSAHRLTCPTFLSKASLSPFFEKKKNALDVLEIIQKTNSSLEFHEVEGTHHVHLNNPERLGPLISAFIMKYDKLDRTDGGIKEELKIASNVRDN